MEMNEQIAHAAQGKVLELVSGNLEEFLVLEKEVIQNRYFVLEKEAVQNRGEMVVPEKEAGFCFDSLEMVMHLLLPH